MKMSYVERAEHTKNPVAKRLFGIMAAKKTNLIVAVDLEKTEQILKYVNEVGPLICALKLHADAIEDFNADFVTKLMTMAQKFNFLILEDRKFADIGKIVSKQYTKGVHKIADWADLVTVHALSGTGTLEAMKKVVDTAKRSAIVNIHMSSIGNLADDEYAKKAVAVAEQHTDFVTGIVSRNLIEAPASFIRFMPGILWYPGTEYQPRVRADQQYMSPDEAIKNRGADVIIVGEAITKNTDPFETTRWHAWCGWSAYQERIAQ
jgi:uridine monophosphate synthetase